MIIIQHIEKLLTYIKNCFYNISILYKCILINHKLYIYHVIFVLILLYSITVSKASKYIEIPIKIIFILVIFIILFQVGVFRQLILDSRNRVQQSKDIINKDKSTI